MLKVLRLKPSSLNKLASVFSQEDEEPIVNDSLMDACYEFNDGVLQQYLAKKHPATYFKKWDHKRFALTATHVMTTKFIKRLKQINSYVRYNTAFGIALISKLSF